MGVASATPRPDCCAPQGFSCVRPHVGPLPPGNVTVTGAVPASVAPRGVARAASMPLAGGAGTTAAAPLPAMAAAVGGGVAMAQAAEAADTLGFRPGDFGLGLV